MKNYYFEIRENGNYQTGVLINVPEDITLEDVKNRMNSDNLEIKSIIVEEIDLNDKDVIIDWDYIEYDIDSDLKNISLCLDEAIDNSMQNEVVYFALKHMKETQCSISDAIQHGFDECL